MKRKRNLKEKRKYENDDVYVEKKDIAFEVLFTREIGALVVAVVFLNKGRWREKWYAPFSRKKHLVFLHFFFCWFSSFKLTALLPIDRTSIPSDCRRFGIDRIVANYRALLTFRLTIVRAVAPSNSATTYSGKIVSFLFFFFFRWIFLFDYSSTFRILRRSPSGSFSFFFSPSRSSRVRNRQSWGVKKNDARTWKKDHVRSTSMYIFRMS